MNFKVNLYNLLILSYILFSYQLVSGQEKPFLINSGEMIKKGIKLHEEGKYDDAEKEYKKVPENDTNYVLALYELSLSARVNKKPEEAKKSIFKALEKSPNPYEHDLYIQLGSVCDEMNQLDSGAYYFNRVLQKYPNSFMAHHARAVNYYLAKNYDSCVHSLKRAILINPYAENSHYFLGVLAKELGYPIQAMMSLGMCLLISPEGSKSIKSITLLNSLSNLSDNSLESIEKRESHSFFKEDYQELETYFKSKIALEKSYKIESELDETIFRQFNLICEKLPSKVESYENFWESFYAPIFKNLFVSKDFNTACLRMISGLNNDKLKQKVNSSKKDIEKFNQWLVVQLEDIGYNRSTIKPIDKSKPGYYFSDAKPVAKGKMKSEKEQKLEGLWEYYGPVGNLTAKRTFSESKLNGLFELYYFNGNLKFKGMYRNDNPHGECINYYESGLVKTKANYTDGKKDGLYTKYYTNGSVFEIENYKNDVLEGATFSNFNSGSIENESAYKDGKVDGLFKEYYENGKLSATVTVKKGNADGEKIDYYNNGALYSKCTFRDGKLDGPFMKWYIGGQVYSKETFKNDKREGECIYYHENGKLSKQQSYENGVQSGIGTSWDDEGRVTLKEEYKKGRLMKLSSYNVLNGQLVKECVIEDKEKNVLQLYNSVGILLKEAVCDREGNYNGAYKEFYTSGGIQTEEFYKNGVKEGSSIEYHKNGNVESKMNYVGGEIDGEVKRYHPNEIINTEGFYVTGKKQGYHYTYDDLGVMIKRMYFIDDELDGINEDYSPAGKIVKREVWNNGDLISLTEYDTNSKAIQKLEYKMGQKTKAKNFNGLGKLSREYSVVNNYLQGEEKEYYPNGELSSLSYNKNGQADSLFIGYHTNGQKAKEGYFENDLKSGAWKTYNRMGQIESVEYFDRGESKGMDTMYSMKGTIETIIPNKDNEKNGWVIKYTPTGELIYKLHYIDDVLVGYTHDSQNGELVPEVKVDSRSGPAQIKTYFKNGSVSSEFTYHNCNYEGKRVFYYPNGKVFYEIFLLQGTANGTEKEYYPNGQLYTSRNYSKGDLIGAQLEYYESGKISCEKMFVNGYQHGATKYYDSTGKLLQVLTFYWGELLDIN